VGGGGRWGRVGGEGRGGGSRASSLRTLLGVLGLRIAEVADPATRIIVLLHFVLYVIIEPLLLPAPALPRHSRLQPSLNLYMSSPAWLVTMATNACTLVSSSARKRFLTAAK
jgi:hypothetical protein